MHNLHAQKVVLAYSGGLDTSIAIRWLLSQGVREVHAVAIDLGQGEDLEAARAKAIAVGASAAHVIDCRGEFIDEFIWPALSANARYEFDYPLATALARPLIARTIAKVAAECQADAVAHGCTAKGNDQVRFELSWSALNPKLKVIAPAKLWGELCDRDKAMQYAAANNIPVSTTKRSPYSIDTNLWGRAVECGILEDPWVAPPEDAFALTRPIEDCPGEPTFLEIEFVRGIPTAINGESMSGLELITKLNRIAGENGVGRIDQVENRLVGIKSREIYEAPAATCLLLAHRELEYLVNPKDLTICKAELDRKFGELIYNGLWFSPLRECLQSFMLESQTRVTGTVKLKLHRANCIVVGRKSPLALYSHQLATYGADDGFDHGAANGFIKLFGLANSLYHRC